MTFLFTRDCNVALKQDSFKPAIGTSLEAPMRKNCVALEELGKRNAAIAAETALISDPDYFIAAVVETALRAAYFYAPALRRASLPLPLVRG